MSGTRPSIFSDIPDPEIDISGFAPKGGPEESARTR